MADLLNSKLTKGLELACAPGVTPGLWAQLLDPFMWQWGIRTPRRMAAFLAQVSVESAGFTTLSENLSYSAGRMLAVWPNRFTPETAEACEHNPEALANVVYCNRMGNGGPETGDGWTFRGAGLIQLTGRYNQTRFADYCKLSPLEVGNYLRTPKGAAESACWAWCNLGEVSLNAHADGWFLTSISRKINGGDEGLQQRIDLSNAILKRIGG